MSERQNTWDPLVIAVAPNGARKTKADHPALPITPKEIAVAAADAVAAGAAMIHLHVRDEQGRHSLDVEAYRAAIAAVRAAVGDDLLIQVTSEAVGIYSPEQQMTMIRELQPEAVSLAVREVVATPADESAAAKFFDWLASTDIVPQFILYSPEDLVRFDNLVARGVLPAAGYSVLFVLGRYAPGQRSTPQDLLPFLAQRKAEHTWSICAFGPHETACVVTAAALGGHARVGFENNLHLSDGRLAKDNAALVKAVQLGAVAIGRPLANAAMARKIMQGKSIN